MAPTETFLGKTYIDFIETWSNWFHLPDLDSNNHGSMVFLRGLSAAAGKGEGVVMVGSDSLVISEDQRIFLPIITSTVVAESGENSQTLYQIAQTHIEAGDNPPKQDQIWINNERFREPLDKFRFESRVFQLNIPSYPPGPSLADYVVPVIKTRDTNLPCVTAGYFVILSLTSGEYDIFCSARGSRDQSGIYRASLFYHIVVEAKRGVAEPIDGGQEPAVPLISSQIKTNLIATLRKKVNQGDIEPDEFKKLKKNIPD